MKKKPSESFNPSEGSEIQISNSLGEKVMSVGAENFLPLRLDISNFPVGIYFCKVSVGIESETKKFVVVK